MTEYLEITILDLRLPFNCVFVCVRPTNLLVPFKYLEYSKHFVLTFLISNVLVERSLDKEL